MTAPARECQPDNREVRLLATLVYESMRFSIWAAGQGIMAERGEPTLDPEDFLFDYSQAMDVDDWEGLAEVARDALTKTQWQLIETYDPAHELNVLVADQGVVSEAYYDGESDSWFKEGKSEHDFDFVSGDRLFPTHWMPMPAAPSVPLEGRGGAT